MIRSQHSLGGLGMDVHWCAGRRRVAAANLKADEDELQFFSSNARLCLAYSCEQPAGHEIFSLKSYYQFPDTYHKDIPVRVTRHQVLHDCNVRALG